MNPRSTDVEPRIAAALALANQGRTAEAIECCERARAELPGHPGLLQLLALLRLRTGDATRARAHAAAALAMRPDHLPTLFIAVDAARALGVTAEARALCERVVALEPGRAETWFQLALLRQDDGDLAGAAAAWRAVLRLQPGQAQAEVNLGIVLQEAGDLPEAMRAYGRALRSSEETFGRIAHALAASRHGRLWLSLSGLREELLAASA